jgi:glycosyltransferase involved in cell wall biosynthesis
MIVIATHNGKNLLKDLLSDITSFNISNEKICVVDNNSTDVSHLQYLKELEKNGYVILHNKNGGYELGAYTYAFDNLKDDVWFTMQDSIRIKQDIFSYVTPLLTNKNVYTFLTVPGGMYDSAEDRLFLMMHYGTLSYSKICFPTAIFALDEVIRKVKDEWYIPKNKIEAMAMERGVAVVFDKYQIEVKGLGVYDPPKTGDPEGYPHFYKIYGSRN